MLHLRIGSETGRHTDGGARRPTPLRLYRQALRQAKQQPCGDTSADAAIEAALCRVVDLVTQQQQQALQERQTVTHSLDLDVSDEPLFLLACAQWQMGLLHQRRDQLAAAEQRLRASLACFPRFVAALSALGQVLKAAAASASQLQEAEQRLQQAVAVGEELAAAQDGLLCDSNKACAAELEAADAARASLAMLLCQAGRDAEAAPHLKALGFRFRLAAEVLQYPISGQQRSTDAEEGAAGSSGGADGGASGCQQLQALDAALPPALLQHLQRVFRPGADFWSQHAYGRVGYFSYFFELAPGSNGSNSSSNSSSMHQLARHLQRVAAPFFPEVLEARFAEFWCHCRRHSSGHQLHFDSDDEGQGGVRHPIITCIVFLSSNTHRDGLASGGGDHAQQGPGSSGGGGGSSGNGGGGGGSSDGAGQAFIGGPTLMTDQVLGGPLASRGWLAYPSTNRVVAFDGRFLHGVAPGRGPCPAADGRRTTLMMAFWRELKCRTPAGQAVGACMHMPDPSQAAAPAAAAAAAGTGGGRTWHRELQPLPDEGAWPAWRPVPVTRLQPVSAVWTAVEAGKSTAGAAYQYCFQGF